MPKDAQKLVLRFLVRREAYFKAYLLEHYTVFPT